MTAALAEVARAIGDDAVVREPDVVVRVTNLHDLRAVVQIAARDKIPLLPRVAGAKLHHDHASRGWVIDLSAMNRICDLDERNQLAVIEPGVTFGQLAQVLDDRRTGLTIGFPLSPAEGSILANCLLDGLGNLSLRHGLMGEWLSGLEVVRADGTVLKTGSWAAGAPPFSRAPLPDLTGLFVSMQGGTGIVSKAAVQLWPARAARERSFLLFNERRDALRVLAELPRLDVLDDAGALFWPAAKMLLGVESPRERDPAEPEVYVYLDIGACDRDFLHAKRAVLDRALARARRAGARFEGPIDVGSFAAIAPSLGRFAEFPTRMDFLTAHPKGGLTWVGTYGPIDGLGDACDAGLAILADHGFPPLVVARPMKGGHFSVLRFIEVFDPASEGERNRVLACNTALVDMLRPRGYVMYKTPGWAVERYKEHLDPGFVRLLGEVKKILDPDGLMSPGRWAL
jgi:FAD/FMN-containing dehydrogenase